MKKLSFLLAFALLVIGSFSLTSVTSAHQDQSFTYTSTAGMFEDMYDFFKYSPAYLPSFKKNSFWGQLSNLESQYDYLYADSPDDDYYLLGGQMDLGVGRLGVMFDWDGYQSGQGATNYNGYSSTGFVESTQVDYRISSGSTVIDSKTEAYSHVKRNSDSLSNDVYIPFGIGGVAGLDLGAAVRGEWWANGYTYDPWVGSYGNVGYTFDEDTYVRNYNLLTGNMTDEFTRKMSGNFGYSSENWRLILGARTNKSLISSLDLVLNLAPIFAFNNNKYKAEKNDFWNFDTATLSTRRTDTTYEGINTNVGMYVSSGIGVEANLRAEFQMTSAVNLIGEGGIEIVPQTLGDNKRDDRIQDVQTQGIGGLTWVRDQNDFTHSKYFGTTGDGNAYAKIRAQMQAQGWKLALGLNYTNNWQNREITTVQEVNNVLQVSGTGSTATDYTQTVTSAYEYKDKYDYLNTYVELPIGLVLNLIENLPIRFGAIHTIQFASETGTREVTSRTPATTVTNYADGSSTTMITAPGNNQDERNYSNYWNDHWNNFYYGVSWWPYKDMQIDITGFGQDILVLNNYRLSFNFYF